MNIFHIYIEKFVLLTFCNLFYFGYHHGFQRRITASNYLITLVTIAYHVRDEIFTRT